MRQLCVSRDGLTLSAPAHADDVRLLLTLLSAAEDLAELETLNSLVVTTTDTVVLLRLGTAEIEGRLTRNPPSRRPVSLQMDTRQGLVIQQIRGGGQSLLRAAG